MTINTLLDAALAVQEWAAYLGGFDAPCWDTLKRETERATAIRAAGPDAILMAVRARLTEYDDALNDEDQDDGPICPNGDDYNEITSDVAHLLAGGELAPVRLTHKGR